MCEYLSSEYVKKLHIQFRKTRVTVLASCHKDLSCKHCTDNFIKMVTRKRCVLSHEETEQFLFEENSENELQIDALVALKVLLDSETEEEVVQEQSSNKLYETQVLENEDLPDESQQETTPENLKAN